MATKLDKEAMRGHGRSITLFGETFGVGMRTERSKMQQGSGIIVLDKPGQVLQGVDCANREIQIKADNCVVRDCYVGVNGWHSIYLIGRATNALLEYLTLDGQKQNKQHTDFVVGDEGGYEMRNCAGFDAPTDYVNYNGGSKIHHNAFFQSGYQTGAHADGTSCHCTKSGGPSKVFMNYIDMTKPDDAVTGSNAAIKIVAHFGDITDVEVYKNVLLGGGYTVYTCDDTNAGHKVTKIRLHNNSLGLSQYGDWYTPRGTDVTWENNTKFETDPASIVAIGSGPTTPPVDPPVDPPTEPGLDLDPIADQFENAGKALQEAARLMRDA